MSKKKYENLTEAEITEIERIKLEKKVRRRSEIKAFLVLLFIVLALGGGTWYWYTHIYDSEKNKKEITVEDKYEVSMIQADNNGQFEKVGNYILLVDNMIVNKVYLSDGTVYDVSANKFVYGNDAATLIQGIDGNLYAYTMEYAEYGGVVILYKFSDGKFSKVKEFKADGSNTYAPILYSNSGENKLIGFAAKITFNDGESATDEVYSNYYIVGVTKDIVKADDYSILGDSAVLSADKPYVTYNDQFITTDKGVLDYTKDKMTYMHYENIYYGINDEWIVEKDDKYAIIDCDLDLKTEFEFDFIAPFDGFYVVSKNDKLAILDNKYKVISDYDIYNEIKYLNKPDGSGLYNKFTAYKIGSNYYVSGLFGISDSIEQENLTYKISKDGDVELLDSDYEWIIKKTSVGSLLIYSYDDETKNVTLYDNDFSEMYTVAYEDVNNPYGEYDMEKYIYVDLIDENNLQVGYSKPVYYDYKSGIKLDKAKEYTISEDDYSITYDYDGSKLIFKENEEVSYNIDSITQKNIYKDSDLYYIVSRKYFIYMLNKGN